MEKGEVSPVLGRGEMPVSLREIWEECVVRRWIVQRKIKSSSTVRNVVPRILLAHSDCGSGCAGCDGKNLGQQMMRRCEYAGLSHSRKKPTVPVRCRAEGILHESGVVSRENIPTSKR